jgi:FkbM family methyltransferase
VFDVGENTGQYASYLRFLGYERRIVSFEPLHNWFKVLEKQASGGARWEALNYALGDEDGTQEIYVSESSESRSILNVLPAYIESEPRAQSVAREKVEVRRLGSNFNSVCTAEE